MDGPESTCRSRPTCRRSSSGCASQAAHKKRRTLSTKGRGGWVAGVCSSGGEPVARGSSPSRDSGGAKARGSRTSGNGTDHYPAGYQIQRQAGHDGIRFCGLVARLVAN